MTKLILMIAVMAVIIIFMTINFIYHYKQSSPQKILVITGLVSENPNEKMLVVSGGGTFVWPIIQKSGYLENLPQQLSLQNDLSLRTTNQNSFDVQLTYAISTEDPKTLKAAEMFYGRTLAQRNAFVKKHLEETIHNYFDSIEPQSGSLDHKEEIQNITSMELASLGLELKNITRITVS